jgi:RimJ/RimL family protein N-acetyltransferase
VTTVTTDRLVLRPFGAEDVEAHARLYDDPEVTRWLGDGPWLGEVARAHSRKTLERFAEEWARHGWGVWAVTDRATGEVMGQCGFKYLQLDPPGAPPEVELLYALERRHWGRGLASEAAAAAVAHGFGALALPRIVAVARPDNHPSRAVLEKLGLVFERELVFAGIPAVCYGLSRAAYLARGSDAPAGRAAS